MKSNEYQRTLSPEEAQENRIMITKDGLRFFPKPFRKFNLKVGEKTFELAVEAEDCQCRGPAQPHQHFWLPMKDSVREIRWGKGTRVVITKGGDGAYTIAPR